MGFLNNINALIVEHLGPLGPMILLGTLGLIMIGVTVALMLAQPEDPMEKLKKQIQAPGSSAPEQRLRQGERNEQLQKFASFLEPQDVAELSARQLMLRQAGYQSQDAVRFFHFAQFALGLAGLLLAFVYLNLLGHGEGFTTQKMMIFTIIPGAVGYYFGTSIADALRVYAGEMRDKRVMRAEEAANKLPTKMTLATMMLTVPPLLIILVGPSVHGITQLGNLGAGQ